MPSLVMLCRVRGAVINTLSADEPVAKRIPIRITTLNISLVNPEAAPSMSGRRKPVASPFAVYPVIRISLFISENTNVIIR
jgi:hypothetical protein